MAAILALALLTFGVPHGDGGIDLVSEMLGATDALPETTVTLNSSADTGASTAAALETIFATDVFAATELDGPRVELAVGARPTGLLGQGIGSGGEREVLSGTGLGSSEFFGISGTGKTFVYVLDCSDSMNSDNRFERAVEELVYSIRRLSPDQRFYVILYNDGAMPMDADDPVPAVVEEFERIESWLNRAVPTGGTYPLTALEYGLSLEPDAIYFLSDGEFDPIVIAALREKNRKTKLTPRKIPIHTIAFASQAGENQMKIIARTSGGKYRFVR